MRSDVTKKLFTVAEYRRMGEAGILSSDDRLELIDGEVVEMSPIGKRHIVCVDRANNILAFALHGRALISVQNPVKIGEYSELQPDIVVLRPRADYYAGKEREPEDVLLLIEVADTSFLLDARKKLSIYAAAGVSEVWIEELRRDVLHVYRQPEAHRYLEHIQLRPGDSIAPLAFPDVTVAVTDLLGKDPTP